MIETAFDPVTVTVVGIILSMVFPILSLIFGIVALVQGNIDAALVFIIIWAVFSTNGSTE